MGSRGIAQPKKTEPGSPDGVFITGDKKEVTVNMTYKTYYTGIARIPTKIYEISDNVAYAHTDNNGNITLNRLPDKTIQSMGRASENTNNKATVNIKAGVLNGKSFNIDWSKVKSVSGETYSIRDEIKKAGLKWNAKDKKWERK